MIGLRLAEVHYVTLEAETAPAHWDHGDFHLPVYGVELVDANHRTFWVTWSWEVFSHEIRVVPRVADCGYRIQVTENDAWKSLLGAEITEVGVSWQVKPGSETEESLYPQTLRMTFGARRAVYFTAAYYDEQHSWLSAQAGDEVGVVFDERAAAKYRLGAVMSWVP